MTDQLRDAVHKVLTDKKCSIWGRPFQIDQFENRDKCVTWIIETLLDPVEIELASHDPGSVFIMNGRK